MLSPRPSGEYAAWASWLDAFATGEDLPDGHLLPVDEAMGPHMQSRVVGRIARAFEARAARWARTLERDLAAVTADPATLAAAMVSARRRLDPLLVLAGDPRLPVTVRDELRSAFDSLVTSAQESLEDSARRGAGGPALHAAVRDNDLRRAFSPPPDLPPVTPRGPRGRRVIL